MNKEPRICSIDIETFPLLIESWGVYEQNALRIIRPFTICAFTVKWLDGKRITKALPDYHGYRPMNDRNFKIDDKKICKDIWKLLDEADIVIAQNGDSFDIKKLNTRFLVHKLPPPSPYKTIDTLKISHSSFGFDSNKLGFLGEQTGHGTKAETGGYGLWVGCMYGDKKAWKKMKEYNRQDVIVLENVYKEFRPWAKQHPNLGIFMGAGVCPKCGSSNVIKWGIARNRTTTYQQFKCKDCKSKSRDTTNLLPFKPLVNI